MTWKSLRRKVHALAIRYSEEDEGDSGMDSHASGQSWMMQILTSVVPYHADAKASLQTRGVSKSSFLGVQKFLLRSRWLNR